MFDSRFSQRQVYFISWDDLQDWMSENCKNVGLDADKGSVYMEDDSWKAIISHFNAEQIDIICEDGDQYFPDNKCFMVIVNPHKEYSMQ